MIRPLLVLFGLVAMTGCSNAIDPATDVLSAHAENHRITLVNSSADPVYYFVADRDALALLDWAVCLEPSRCAAVPPNSTRSLAYSEIAAYQEGSSSAVVYHWRIVSKPTGGNAYDTMREMVVRLK
ncbi:MAG TPA: hypothetical protein VJL35_00740 [Gemmatimonadaceae bacterium]|nr:hypothetical protein [Gemmatimonadaceae bacterium]